MISWLTNTDLVSLHDHIDRLSIETDAKCVKALAKIRQDKKRWAPVYDSEVDTSFKLCTMKVKACEQVHKSIYTVTDDDDVTSTVNLDTKIVHQGYVYTVPTCTCGYWCSLFRMCKCNYQSTPWRWKSCLNCYKYSPYPFGTVSSNVVRRIEES